MKLLIAEPEGFDAKAQARLSERFEVTVDAVDQEKFADAFGRYDAIWFRLGFRVDEQMAQSGRCRALAVPVTGLDHVDLEACAKHGVQVHSLKGETEFLRTVTSTAELAVGLALALLRQIPAATEEAASGLWQRDHFWGHTLAGKTVGILGVGRLGTLAAERFGAFGCTSIGYDVRDVTVPGVEMVGSLPELLQRSDIVSVHADYRPDNHHLLDAAAFAKMKPGTYLVNTARGGLVDEGALLQSLERGHLAGAALDVLQDELEFHAEHPMAEFARRDPRLLLVPHIGGHTRESVAMTERFLAEKLMTWAKHEDAL